MSYRPPRIQVLPPHTAVAAPYKGFERGFDVIENDPPAAAEIFMILLLAVEEEGEVLGI